MEGGDNPNAVTKKLRAAGGGTKKKEKETELSSRDVLDLHFEMWPPAVSVVWVFFFSPTSFECRYMLLLLVRKTENNGGDQTMIRVGFQFPSHVRVDT